MSAQHSHRQSAAVRATGAVLALGVLFGATACATASGAAEQSSASAPGQVNSGPSVGGSAGGPSVGGSAGGPVVGGSGGFGGSGPDLSACPKGVVLYNEKAVAASTCLIGHYEGTLVQGIRDDADTTSLGRPCSVDFNGLGKDGLFVADSLRIVLWNDPDARPSIGYVRTNDAASVSFAPSLRFSNYVTDHRFSPYGPGTWMGRTLSIDRSQAVSPNPPTTGNEDDIALRIMASADDEGDESIYYCGVRVRVRA